MLEAVSSRLAGKMAAHGTIKEEDRETYEYGVYVMLSTVIHILTVLLIGAVFRMILESIVFYASYAVLRKFAGGFHASSPIRCYLISCVTISGALLAARYLPVAYILPTGVFILLFACSVIFFLSPVEDENKQLDSTEVVHYKKTARILLLIEVGISVLLFLIKYQQLALSICLSLFTLAIMLLIGMAKNRSTTCGG